MGSVTVPRVAGIKREIVYRVQIAIFWLLCMLLANTILQPVSSGVHYFAVAALIELFIIQAMRGLFGDTPLIRDACEINCYCFLVHLVAIPIYFSGIKSIYHNAAINAFWGIYAIRLCYFGAKRADGEYGGWAKFGVLGCIHQLINKYGNNPFGQQLVYIGKTVIVLGTIIPMWLITIQTSDQNTSLFTILATSFILIYGYWKNEVANRNRDLADKLLNDETIPLCKAYNKRSSDARMLIRQMVLQDFTVQDIDSYLQHMAAKAERARQRATMVRARIIKRLVRLRRENAALRTAGRMFFYGVLLGVMMLFASLYRVVDRTRLVSYAAGYIDAKTGKQPKTETDLKQMVGCMMRQGGDKPLPPDEQCDKFLRFNK